MKLHDRESAKGVKAGDVLRVDPEWNLAISPYGTSALQREVQVQEVLDRPNCQTGTAFQVLSKQGRSLELDAGWFYRGEE